MDRDTSGAETSGADGASPNETLNKEVGTTAADVEKALEKASDIPAPQLTDEQFDKLLRVVKKELGSNLDEFTRRLDRIERITGIGKEGSTADEHHRS